MNILYYCNEYPPCKPGGIGVFTRELAEELKEQGHNVFVYGQYNIENAFHEKINGVTIYRDKRINGKFSFIENRIRAYFELKKIIKDHSIDILEVQDFCGPIAFFPRFSCKTIVRLHGSVIYFKTLLNGMSIKDKIWFHIEKSCLNKADTIISVSDFTANLTAKIFNIKKDIQTIHNGVKVSNTQYTHSFSENKKYLFSGSVIKKKGIIELISAWMIFSKNKNNVFLDVYGKDIEGLTERLKLHMEKLHVNNVFFHDAVNKDVLLLAIKDADFCVFPTKAEAFSLAPMEAMSMSKVVLYTDQTSARELVIHRSNGLLINGCSEISILESLEESFSLTEEEYKKISKNAYCTIVNNFNVEDKVIKNIRIYQELLNQSDVK